VKKVAVAMRGRPSLRGYNAHGSYFGDSSHNDEDNDRDREAGDVRGNCKESRRLEAPASKVRVNPNASS
jgi:hypothetical protein